MCLGCVDKRWRECHTAVTVDDRPCPPFALKSLKEEDESEEAQEADQESEKSDNKKEPAQTCTVDPATGTCAEAESE